MHQVSFLYNYIPYLFAYFPWCAPNKGTHRKRVSIGENEKKLIVECYNLCHGKEWKEVLMFAKHRVTEAGLPEQVVHMYLEQSTERLTQRMKNIIKNALRSPQPATPSTSTAINETSYLIANKMRYAKRITPNERRMEAVKRKMESELLVSSSNSEEEEDQGEKKKKRKMDLAKEAQEAHKKMCEKAMDTMDTVKSILLKVDLHLDKGKK